jgi:hypothetical protein
MTEDEKRVAQQRAALIPLDTRPQPTLPAHTPDRTLADNQAAIDAEQARQRRLIDELHNGVHRGR